jgi:hypothetical protein
MTNNLRQLVLTLMASVHEAIQHAVFHLNDIIITHRY